jgi:hypothetical protein
MAEESEYKYIYTDFECSLTSRLNGIKTVGHRFAIVANHFYPLNEALGMLETFSTADGDVS